VSKNLHKISTFENLAKGRSGVGYFWNETSSRPSQISTSIGLSTSEMEERAFFVGDYVLTLNSSFPKTAFQVLGKVVGVMEL
jgi:hypothetical protein